VKKEKFGKNLRNRLLPVRCKEYPNSPPKKTLSYIRYATSFRKPLPLLRFRKKRGGVGGEEEIKEGELIALSKASYTKGQ